MVNQFGAHIYDPLAVVFVISLFVMLNADVRSIDDIIEDGLDNRVVDEADVVDIFIVVVVVAAS